MITVAKKCGGGVTIDGGGKWRSFSHPDVVEYIENGGIVEDEFTQEDLEVQRIGSIKTEARSRIIVVMDDIKQRNSLAELIALQATPLAEWTPDMEELFIKHKTAWSQIDAIRKASNQMEAGEDVAWPI